MIPAGICSCCYPLISSEIHPEILQGTTAGISPGIPSKISSRTLPGNSPMIFQGSLHKFV